MTQPWIPQIILYNSSFEDSHNSGLLSNFYEFYLGQTTLSDHRPCEGNF